MRSSLGLAASALAGLAAVVASLDDAAFVPFFVGLTFFGGAEAWAAHAPFVGRRRSVARAIALLWLIAAIWVGVLLLLSVTVWHGSGPPPGPVVTYLGLTASVYHVVGLYGGVALVLASAFGPERPMTVIRQGERE